MIEAGRNGGSPPPRLAVFVMNQMNSLKTLAAVCAGIFCLSGLLPAQSPVPDWKRITEHAEWQPRDSPGEVVFKDQLWIFGGWFSSSLPAPRDVWSSRDGKTWNLVQQEAPWIHSDLPMSIVFQDKMWMMGGWYNGRLPGNGPGNQVWSSENGIDWKQEAEHASWSARFASALVEFKGKLWLLGGCEQYHFGNADSIKNDVWSSSDGKSWKLETPHAGWSPRAYHQAAVLNDRIYVFGGGNYLPEYSATNDVWSSADGVNWQQETSSAPWHERLWFSTVVYRGKIWVLGGWSNNPYKNWNDVWYSSNGREWTELKTEHIWGVRHEHAAYVFQDQIWIAGGLQPPLNNDVWALHLPEDWTGE